MNKTLRKLLLTATMLVTVGAIAGCVSANKKVFMAEYATAATADASMRGYATYFDRAIVNPEQYNRTAPALVAERALLSDISIKTGISIDMVEHLRVSASTNSAVKPSLTAALEVMSQNQSNLLWTANQLLRTSTNH